jgi:hypothetical protein
MEKELFLKAGSKNVSRPWFVSCWLELAPCLVGH